MEHRCPVKHHLRCYFFPQLNWIRFLKDRLAHISEPLSYSFFTLTRNITIRYSTIVVMCQHYLSVVSFTVSVYNFDPSRQYIGTMTLEIDFLQKKSVDSSPYDSDKMAIEFVQFFNVQSFSKGQQVKQFKPVRFRNISFKWKCKFSLWSMYHHICTHSLSLFISWSTATVTSSLGWL